MSSPSSNHNLAARMAVWSSRHRKKAFWGWLAFVIAVFGIGNAIGTTNISDVDQFSGESHRAEQGRAGPALRRANAVVFVQGKTPPVKARDCRAPAPHVAARLSRVK